MATRAEWAERVERWEASGLSAAEFAEGEHLVARRLSWWRWKLRSSSSAPSRAASVLDFLPVRVVEAAPPRRSTPGPIEIVLPNGRVVRVLPDFDAAALERVLAVASGRGTC